MTLYFALAVPGKIEAGQTYKTCNHTHPCLWTQSEYFKIRKSKIQIPLFASTFDFIRR